MRGSQPLVAVVVLALLVHLGMAVRTAVALRQVGVPATRAWTASLLAWPLVRRLAARHAVAVDDAVDDASRATDAGDTSAAAEDPGHPRDG